MSGLTFDFSKVRLGNSINDLPKNTWLLATIEDVKYEEKNGNTILLITQKVYDSVDADKRPVQVTTRITQNMGWLLAAYLAAAADLDVSGQGPRNFSADALRDTFVDRNVEIYLTEGKPDLKGQTWTNVNKVRAAQVVPQSVVVEDDDEDGEFGGLGEDVTPLPTPDEGAIFAQDIQVEDIPALPASKGKKKPKKEDDDVPFDL